jgi:hypothetical protein
VNDLKILGLNINNTLTWKFHTETILPKLSSACFAMRSIKQFISQQMLKAIYYSHFHAIISYGLMFWGNSAHSARVFRMQKRIIRIMTGSRSRDSCRKLTILKFFHFLFYIFFSILRVFTKNRELFTTNNEIHELDTRQVHNFHLPPANLKKYQPGVIYMGVTLHNSFPSYIEKEYYHIIKV